ncbi:hypothetical protein GCK72_013102 [Caenorhabditis remanei]|uniref:Uncharacterized protein n=1 Tax=Caenorhabditis remanei TaxID=31234 RepID=A0A6A5GMP5_CAERE|nr:hypothetical protein GCK72_013102 [Caenorhabditis remanei]KAF1756648.1 hypothetical protein GCK72_013102 [Caenorhabditis remanei]
MPISVDIMYSDVIATIDDGINEKVTLTDETDVSNKVKEYLDEKYVKTNDVELEHVSILLSLSNVVYLIWVFLTDFIPLPYSEKNEKDDNSRKIRYRKGTIGEKKGSNQEKNTFFIKLGSDAHDEIKYRRQVRDTVESVINTSINYSLQNLRNYHYDIDLEQLVYCSLSYTNPPQLPSSFPCKSWNIKCESHTPYVINLLNSIPLNCDSLKIEVEDFGFYGLLKDMEQVKTAKKLQLKRTNLEEWISECSNLES